MSKTEDKDMQDFLADSIAKLDEDYVEDEKTPLDEAIESSGDGFETKSEDEEVTSKDTIETLIESEAEAETKVEDKEGDEVVEFTPNFAYKVKDEEREIPEEFRSFIKDQETQDKIVDLFTKADGLEAVKVSRQKLQEQFDSQRIEYENINKAMTALENMTSVKDVQGLMKAASFSQEDVLNSIPEEVKLQHVMELLKRQESPEASREYERAREIEKENLRLKHETQRQSAEFTAAKVEAEKLEIETTMSNPDVQNWKSELDGRAGNGAFIEAVAEVGMAYYATHGHDMSMREAVEIVKKRYGLGQPVVELAPTEKKEVPTSVVRKVVTKSSMPDIEGAGESPVNRGISSIEDIIAERDRHFKLKKG